jgi:signal peptidase complex subunit 1
MSPCICTTVLSTHNSSPTTKATLTCVLYTLPNLYKVFSFIAGYYTQNVYNSVYVGLAGTALTFLVVVPAWPFFNKNPARWLPVPHKNSSLFTVEVDGKKVE